jgi:futalosine hydrolase
LEKLKKSYTFALIKINSVMTILLVSATESECTPILQKMSDYKTTIPWLYSGTLQGQSVEVLISGIGAIATTFRLTQTLINSSYNRVISMGIAGSFIDDILLEEVVQITEDCFADLGIDNNGTFLNLREAGLTDADDHFLPNPSPIPSLHRKVRGITIQIVTGSQKRIDELVNRYQPEVETMENAAFFYVCQKMNVPFASFRAISNKVEPRNRENWRISEAIEQMNLVVGDLFSPKNSEKIFGQ